MELLNRYLRSVKPLLPREEREDILAELSEEIRSAMDERERAVGRPLTEAEQNEILGQFGPPLVVGGRYRPSEGTLSFGKEIIGREIFPFYVRALKIQLGLSSAVVCVVFATMSFWQLVGFDDLLRALALQVSIQGSVVTLCFAYVQSLVRRNPGQWDLTQAANHPAHKDSSWSLRFEAIVQFLVCAALLPWLHTAFGVANVLSGAGVVTAAWHNAYWPVMGATVATMLFSLARVLRQEVSSYRRQANLALDLVMLATSIYLLLSGPWLTVVNPAKQQEIRAINEYVFRDGLIASTITIAAAAVYEAFKLLKRSDKAGKLEP